MKKSLLVLVFLVLVGFKISAQSTGTLEVQFYVDGNSNCQYNAGEQLLHNVPFNFSFVQTNGTVVSTANSSSFTSCGSTTLWVWSYSTTPTNTIHLNPNGGITANACGNFTNLPYNSNTIIYLPVIASGTANLGAGVNVLYSSNMGTSNYTNVTHNSTTISLCSNIGSDSLTINLNMGNVMSCTGTNTLSPRSYSLYFDGVNYDVLTFTGGNFSSSFTTGVNALSTATEWYTNGQTQLSIYPQLPATFSVLGTHTFEVKSSLIYNNPTSAYDLKFFLNSIPCTKISGLFYNDCNNNCTFDANDTYGVGWAAQGYIYNSNGVNLTFYPNSTNGAFNVYLPTNASYSLTQYPSGINSPVGFTACTTGTITIPASATTNTFLFGYKNNGTITVDPGVHINRINSTSNVISPGVGITFGVILSNNWLNMCNSPVINPGKVKVTLPKFINYVSNISGPTPTFVPGANLDTLIYAVPDFSAAVYWWSTAFSSFSAVVNATAVPNATFNIQTIIYPTTDVNLSNNVYNWSRYIGGPFDPNGKYCQNKDIQPNGDVPFGTQEFIYEIGFQNIGNAPAINVTTLDTMDANFDVNSLRVLQSSYPVSTQIDRVTRLVGFHFKGINLPDATTNEAGSHGFVRYSIKLKPGVPVNTVLKNRGHNYFDFNEAIATNQTSNKLVIALAVNENGTIVSNVRAVPNPFNNRLTIDSDKEIISVQVYNLSGQLVMDLKIMNGKPELDMTSYPASVYLIKVTNTNLQSSFIKVVKE